MFLITLQPNASFLTMGTRTRSVIGLNPYIQGTFPHYIGEFPPFISIRAKHGSLYWHPLLPLWKEFSTLPNMQGNHILEQNGLYIVLSNVVCVYPERKPPSCFPWGCARITFANAIYKLRISAKILKTVEALVQTTPSPLARLGNPQH